MDMNMVEVGWVEGWEMGIVGGGRESVKTDKDFC